MLNEANLTFTKLLNHVKFSFPKYYAHREGDGIFGKKCTGDL